MPSESDHRYTFAGFDGPYWEAKQRREAQLAARVAAGCKHGPEDECHFYGCGCYCERCDYI